MNRRGHNQRDAEDDRADNDRQSDVLIVLNLLAKLRDISTPVAAHGVCLLL